MEQKLLGVRAAADYLGVSEPTVRLWVKQGRLPTVRFGRKIFIPEAEVHSVLTANYRPATAPPPAPSAPRLNFSRHTRLITDE